MFVWNRFILIFVAIIAIFKYGYGLDASKIKLPDGLMQMCKDWSRRYGIYIPTGEECDQIPLTFLTTFLSSVDVMPGYMVEMFHNLLPPPPVAMSKNFPQSPPPDSMANQGPPPNMNGGGSLGIMSPKHYTITKHLIGNYTDNGWKCKTLACLCPHLNGRLISETKTCILPNGKILKKAIRKEYRTLTDDERHRYHSAFKQLMANGIFDEISSIHVYVAEGSNVHGRPKFWSWHRKYLKKIELELRKIDSDLFLPYWDTTLDQGIPNPYDSIMWTDDFMGRSDENGTVISGPAAHWITLSKKPLQRRNKSDGIEGELYKENDLRLVLKETQVDMPRKTSGKFKYYFECPIQLDLLETAHATAHDFIGGDMADLESASNEPVFYMLHCFIDLIYEIWRQQKDPNCHAGLIEEEPDETFGYAPRPRCSQDNIDCGSKNLFCDLSRREPRCAVKIKTGGICIGLRNEDQPCFEGSCRQNRCVDENTENISPIPADFKDKRPEEASDSNEQEDLDLINFAIKEYKLMEVMMGKPPMHHST